MPERKILDASTLEGGGQLLRLSLALSALLSLPLRLHSIRGGRPKGGGLRAQHRACVRWLASACGATVEGDALKSQTLDFSPPDGRAGAPEQGWWRSGRLDGKSVRKVDVQVEGSEAAAVTLVLQAVLPFLLFAPGADEVPFHLTLRGGTNVTFSPSVEYVQHVLFPNLTLLGLPTMEVCRPVRRGWMSSRAGEVSFLVHPLPCGSTLSALVLPEKRGRVTKLTAITVASPVAIRSSISDRLRRRAKKTWPDAQMEVVEEESGHPARLYILLVAETASGFRLGADFLLQDRIVGRTDRDANKMVSAVVDKVSAKMEEEIGAGGDEDAARCLDTHMEDQVVLYMALAKGRSSGRFHGSKGKERTPSLHTQTARWVVGELLGIDFDDGGGCEGIGLVAGTKIPRELGLEREIGELALDET